MEEFAEIFKVDGTLKMIKGGPMSIKMRDGPVKPTFTSTAILDFSRYTLEVFMNGRKITNVTIVIKLLAKFATSRDTSKIVHDGQKNYKCNHCNKAFGSS